MKIKIAIAIFLLASGQFHQIAIAQKMEAPRDREPGDRLVLNLTVNGKSHVLEENWTALTAEEMIGFNKYGDKELEIIMTRSPHYELRKGICFGSGQKCSFSPGVKFADFPLEVGKKWTTSYSYTGETFSGEETEERIVEKIETIRVPAGEFEAYKIKSTGRFKGKDAKGYPYTGKDESAMWLAVVSGKMVVSKVEYKNSSGDKYAFELVLTSFK